MCLLEEKNEHIVPKWLHVRGYRVLIAASFFARPKRWQRIGHKVHWSATLPIDLQSIVNWRVFTDESDELCICWLCQAGFGQVKALSCAFYLSGTSRITHTRLASRRRAWKLRRYRIPKESIQEIERLEDEKLAVRFETYHMVIHIFAVFTFGMLATSNCALVLPGSSWASECKASISREWWGQNVFGRTWRITPGRLLWEETRWSEIPPAFSVSYLPTYLPTHLPICLLLYLSIYLAVCLFVCPSIILSVNVLPLCLNIPGIFI